VERGKRCLNALPLVLGDQARKHLPEVRVPGTGMDVLPAVGLEKSVLNRTPLSLLGRAAALRHKITRIGFGLGLQNAVHGGDQLDEFVDRPIALFRSKAGVVAHPLEFVEDRVLAFLLPVRRNTSLNSSESWESGSMLCR
jgi:hypothetical protein